jgi:hypothetical protein
MPDWARARDARVMAATATQIHAPFARLPVMNEPHLTLCHRTPSRVRWLNKKPADLPGASRIQLLAMPQLVYCRHRSRCGGTSPSPPAAPFAPLRCNHLGRARCRSSLSNFAYNSWGQTGRLMAECDWAILCDYAFLDSNRKQCLIGAFDRVFAPNVPSGLARASIALKILGDPNEQVSFRLEIMRPTGPQLLAAQGSAAIPAESSTADVQFNLVGVPLPDYGVYLVNVFVNDAASKQISFQVMPPQPAPA